MPKRKKSKDISEAKKKSRAKFSCHPDFDYAIKVANVFRLGGYFSDYQSFAEHYLPILKRLVESECEMWLKVSNKIDRDEYLEQESKRIESEMISSKIATGLFIFSPIYDFQIKAFRNGKGFPRPDTQTFRECEDNFTAVKQTSDSLFQLAEALNEIRKGNRASTDLPSFETKTFLSISEDNKGKKLKTRPNIFGLHLVNDIDPDRLRICEICKSIFWAKRKDSETCSAVCFNSLRQQRYRNENKEKIKAERKARYEQNKKLKEMRKKKNGNL